MRIQLRKIQEAMGKIRRNALNYSVKDYEEILLENLDYFLRPLFNREPDKVYNLNNELIPVAAEDHSRFRRICLRKN